MIAPWFEVVGKIALPVVEVSLLTADPTVAKVTRPDSPQIDGTPSATRKVIRATVAAAVSPALVPEGGTALTHCNAGPLACGGLGTARGCLIAAHRAGRTFRVLADETRPLLQGARLTALELAAEGIEVAVLPDGAAPSPIARGEVQAAFVGADRIARNGDFANKIGTYPLALAAHAHGIPFYVAAPMSTFDAAIADGRHIPIEERPGSEVLTLHGTALTADVIAARNPAFDVSPAQLVTAFVTDRGVLRPPFASAIKAAFAVCR